MKKNIARLILVSAFFWASFSGACFHYYGKTPFRESLRKVFLFHDGKEAHMVLSTTLASKKFPKEIAWVLPLPALPSHYEEINGPVFMELDQIAPDNSQHMLGVAMDGAVKGLGSGKRAALKEHATVAFDHYVIQPIEILKDDSAAEFNAWLEKNKFNPMPYKNQKRYLKKGSIFLAIRMKMNNPGEGILVSRPLHVAYPAAELSFPLLFTHDNRVFDMDLYVFSQKEMKMKLTDFYLREVTSKKYFATKRDFPFVDSLVGKKDGYMTRFSGRALNNKNKSFSTLKGDPTFAKEQLF